MVEIDALELRKLNFEGVQTLVNWAYEEGWNPGPFDAKVFWATDPNGFYGYFHEDVLIAGGALVSYNGEFGFMGLFIVKPEYRALGIGRKLWYQRRDLLLSRLNEGASIGMDGVVAMQGFYQKGGFEIAFKDERYEKIGEEFPMDENIFPVEEQDFSDISIYDKECFGFPRENFLKEWLQLPENRTFKYHKNGRIRGYCVVRKAATGFKIGPLFADDARIAEELYKTCLNSAIGESLYLDLPMSNPEAVELVKKYDAQYVFECARMYYGQVPSLVLKKVFGITTFELG